MKKYLLTIDQGTTSTRVILFDNEGNIVSSSQLEIGIICKDNGWVEQNANEIWESVLDCLKMVLTSKKINPFEIAAIGITNQRETTIMWDKFTGKVFGYAIVWQSRQSLAICKRWQDLGYEQKVKEKTGLVINPYFSASKIKWIIENNKQVQEKLIKEEVLFGTVDSFLMWMLSEGKYHITDYSNASRTMLFNIKTLQWDQELLDLFEIPSSILPKVKSSSEIYGKASVLKKIVPNLSIDVASLIGDQQAALFGHCCFEEGMVKNTYGTGCFMLMNTKEKFVNSKYGLLTTIAWGINGQIEYALEGSVFVGGSAVQWLRDGMRLFKKSSDVELSSQLVKGSNGVYVVPAFVGLGTPYWCNEARGAVFGITRSTTREHFINATVEAIAYQSCDVMKSMKEDAKIDIKTLAVDGGASINNYLMQFQSDILSCKIVRAKCQEITALGAAYLAGLASKVFSDLDELCRLQQTEQIFMPVMTEEQREKLYQGWQKAVFATMTFK